MALTKGNGASWLKVDQDQSVADCIKLFGMQGGRRVRVPIAANTYLCAVPDDAVLPQEGVNLYRQLVGKLMYAGTHTRPDISYICGHLGKFMQKPGASHLEAARQALRYLASTQSWGLSYARSESGDVDLVGYSDANFAMDQDRHSIGAYCFLLNGGIISWSSHRIKHVCLSTEEAELTAAGEAARELIALRSILVQLGVVNKSVVIPLFVDNKPAVTVATNPGYYNRLKHVDIQNKFICEASEKGLLKVLWCEGSGMVADALTKPLNGPMLDSFRKTVMRE